MGKRRLRSLVAIGGHELAGFDIRSDRRVEVSGIFNVSVYDDFQDALREFQPSAIIISVPPDQHHIYMDAAADSKIHFFVEASVINTGIERVKYKLKKSEIIGYPSSTLMHHPAIRQIERIVHTGQLGKISNITYHSGQYLPDWHVYESVKDYYVSNPVTGGAREIVPFEMTWFTHIFGYPLSVCANFKKTIKIPGAEMIDDTYNLLFEYEDFLASITIDVVSRHATRRLLINGAEGQLTWNWDDQHIGIYRCAQQAWDKIQYSLAPSADGYNANISEQMYVDELAGFLDTLSNNAQPVNTLGKDQSVLNLLYACERSHQNSLYQKVRGVKVGILITARLGSKRLSNKHMAHVNGEPILKYLIRRIAAEFKEEINNGRVQIIIATSDMPENAQFRRFETDGATIVFGADVNIPLRHLQVAKAQNLDLIVSIDGDDILCSTRAMREVYSELLSGKPYVQTRGLPLGLNALGYSVDFLESSMVQHRNDVLETGWTRIFDKDLLHTVEFTPSHANIPLRFTLDYAEDLEFFRKVIDSCSEKIIVIDDDLLIDSVVNSRQFEINSDRSEEYWNNFNDSVETESTLRKDR